MSYNVFARYYDQLTANINYQKRGKYFDAIIKKFKTTENNILLDLGCGTGSLSEVMASLNYDVIGVDFSMEMLNVAMDKKFDSNLPIQYILQDMRKLDMYGTADIVLCALDSLNHLPSFDDVSKVFERVSLFTEPKGLFIFDVNTVYKHSNILSNNTFTYETDDVYCIWENEFDAQKNEVKINLEFFEREDDVYYRSSESFVEKAYDINLIDEALVKNGFVLLAHYDDDSFDLPHNKSERIVVVARKI